MHATLIKHTTLFLLLFLWSATTSFAQDIIHLKNERIIAAKVIQVDSSYVYYNEITDLKSPPTKLALTEVSHIRFDYTFKGNGRNNDGFVRAKNAISFGSGGTGGVFSLNYDRVLLEKGDFFLSGKIGVGSWLSQTNINIHVTGNYSFGAKRHYLEFGLGTAVALNQFDKYYRYYISAPLLGYRLHDKSERFFFRSYACVYSMIGNWGVDFAPMIGIDLGYSF